MNVLSENWKYLLSMGVVCVRMGVVCVRMERVCVRMGVACVKMGVGVVCVRMEVVGEGVGVIHWIKKGYSGSNLGVV